MAQSIRTQALFLLFAAGLGAGLGLLYDLLRPLRRRTNDALWDLLFCAAAALGCFCFAMYGGSGRLGSGQLAAALTGFLLYVHGLRPSVAPVLERTARGIGNIWVFIGRQLKKIQICEKKFFKKSEE